jgi:putative ABC transport system permease protein
VATALRDIVHQIDPELPIDDVKPLDASIGEAIAQPRFQTMLLMVCAGAALVLALVGVYGVISYAVSQRRRELGVRAALGATPIDLLTLAAIGALAGLVGLVGTFALSGLLKGLLHGVGATDPLTLAAATLALLLVAAIASAVPARRAMRQDPLTACATISWRRHCRRRMRGEPQPPRWGEAHLLARPHEG